jgi:hypothetical protein
MGTGVIISVARRMRGGASPVDIPTAQEPNRVGDMERR